MEISTKSPKIVILTPVYNEEENLPLYEESVRETLLSNTEYDFEVLFIEDGSTDQSWNLISAICNKDPRFRGIRLSRNFGPHIALSAGFAVADGDAITTLACDLQDPPEVILEFIKKWREGAQIVWGSRQKREDTNWRLLASLTFYKLIRRFAMPKSSKFTTGSFFLIDRKVSICLKQFNERNRVTFALVAWTGFTQEVVNYDRRKRIKGKSSWDLNKMIKTMYDTFIGFSFLPIRLMIFSGVFVSLLTIPIILYLIFNWITGVRVLGWTSVMLSLVMLFGLHFFLISLIGEYLYRIYSEVVRRPLYFVSDIAGSFEHNLSNGNRYPV